jgi:hypothetical protein
VHTPKSSTKCSIVSQFIPSVFFLLTLRYYRAGGGGGGFVHTFTFDHVYDQDASQQCVYDNTARAVVESSLQG